MTDRLELSEMCSKSLEKLIRQERRRAMRAVERVKKAEAILKERGQFGWREDETKEVKKSRNDKAERLRDYKTSADVAGIQMFARWTFGTLWTLCGYCGAPSDPSINGPTGICRSCF